MIVSIGQDGVRFGGALAAAVTVATLALAATGAGAQPMIGGGNHPVAPEKPDETPG